MKDTKSSRWVVTIALAAVLAFSAGAAQAATVKVFVDFSSFTARLGSLAVAAGVTAFSAGEEATIEAGIVSALTTQFAGYDIAFSTSAAGGYSERILFGVTGGGLGVANQIDWKNKNSFTPDEAGVNWSRVFTANFGFILDEFTGSGSRATQISQITAALAGTGGHELGHNTGLRHYDSFGEATLILPFGGGSGGVQNTHAMATGSTGLGEVGRETARAFSDFSKAKLEFGDDLSFSPIASTAETGVAHGSAPTAQLVTLNNLSVASGYASAALVEGAFLGSSEIADYYKVSVSAGATIAVQVISSGSSNVPGGGGSDLTVDIVDPGFTTVLGSNTDIFYTTTTINAGGTQRSNDAYVVNVIATFGAGDYFIRVFRDTRTFGPGWNYDLLIVTTDAQQAPPQGAPEPASLALLVLGVGAVIRRRRKSAA